jgi:hypothetical protein
LVSAAGKLDKIEAKFLELLTQLLSLLWVKSLALKLDRVELNTDDEAMTVPTPDFCCDFKDYTRDILEAASILIVALVGRSGEELRKDIAVATM